MHRTLELEVHCRLELEVHYRLVLGVHYRLVLEVHCILELAQLGLHTKLMGDHNSVRGPMIADGIGQLEYRVLHDQVECPRHVHDGGRVDRIRMMVASRS